MPAKNNISCQNFVSCFEDPVRQIFILILTHKGWTNKTNRGVPVKELHLLSFTLQLAQGKKMFPSRLIIDLEGQMSVNIYDGASPHS